MKLDEQWQALTYLTSLSITQSRNDTDLASKYVALLNGVRHDRMVNGSRVLGMFYAPASKDRHHAFEGGLVAHLLEMWDCWKLLRHEVMAAPAAHPITDSLVWRAILHHDLNKVWRYKIVMPSPEWEVDYAKGDEDSLGHLLPSTFKTLAILNRFEIPMPPILMNALVTAEGGFSEGPRPRTETVFAKLIYLCDELSANVLNRLAANLFWDSKKGGLGGDTSL